MENAKGAKKRKMFSKNQSRVSSRGRNITTPKSILSTSEDELTAKKSKKSSSLDEKMKVLKNLAVQFQLRETTNISGEKNSPALVNAVITTGSNNSSLLHVSKGKSNQSNQKEIDDLSQGMDFDTVHDVIATSSDNSQMVRCSGNEISKLNETKTNNLTSDENSSVKADLIITPHSVNSNSGKIPDKLNQKNSCNMSQVKNSEVCDSKLRVGSSKASQFPPNRTTNSEESEESFNNNLRKTLMFASNFSETSNRTETFVDLPILNIPPGTFEDFGEISRHLQVLKSSVDEIQQKSDEIFNQNKEILQLLRSRFSTEQLANKLYQHLDGFPLSTVEQFFNLEEITNKHERQKVHDHLIQLGGTSLKEFLSCALRQVMTDELVLKFTWQKQKNTEKFGDTRISNIFFQAAVNCPLFTGPDSKAAYKETMLGVLKSTKQRCRNKFKKIPNHDLERRVEKAIEDISALLEPEASNDGSEADVEDEDNDSSDYEEDENFN